MSVNLAWLYKYRKRMKKLGTLKGEGYESIIWEANDGRVFFIADADIDADGGSNPDGDPDWQPDTTLHYKGKPIDAETVKGMVVPGWLPKAVRDIVLGSQGRVTNLATMQSSPSVVHDKGPTYKDGELTPPLARAVGVNPNSRTGGEDRNILLYEFWPGQAALVDGILYDLQPS